MPAAHRRNIEYADVSLCSARRGTRHRGVLGNVAGMFFELLAF